MRPWLPLLLLIVSGQPQSSERPAAPTDGCMDARTVRQAYVLPNQRVLVQTAEGRFGMTLVSDCVLPATEGSTLLAPHGWVCGERSGAEFVRAGQTTCAVRSLEPVGAREFAAEIRALDSGQLSDVATLETVQVSAAVPKQRSFARSAAYCFNPRHSRSWSRDGRGLLVTTSARRSGGNRLYRVEVGRSCPELDMAQMLEFRSAIGGAICGNPGDVALASSELPQSRPLDGVSDTGFSTAGIFSQLATMRGCPIVAVYPVASSAER